MYKHPSIDVTDGIAPIAHDRPPVNTFSRALQEVNRPTGPRIERATFAVLVAPRDREVDMPSFIDNGAGAARFVGR